MSDPKHPDHEPVGRLRTYENDVQEMLKTEKVSLSDIALADATRKASPPSTTETPSSAVEDAREIPAGGSISALPFPSAKHRGGARWLRYGLLAAALVVLGGAFLVFGRPSKETALPPEELVTVGTTLTLSGTESRIHLLKKILELVEREALSLNEVRKITLSTGGAPITASRFFQLLEARAPAPLVRSLDPLFGVGIHAVQGNKLLLLFKVVSYEHAFGGMFDWEGDLLDDLGPLFGVDAGAVAQTEATTTEGVFSNRLQFKDTIVRNKDARAIFDPNGEIIFLYSFLDKESLLITTEAETLTVLLSKVSEGRLK